MNISSSECAARKHSCFEISVIFTVLFKKQLPNEIYLIKCLIWCPAQLCLDRENWPEYAHVVSNNGNINACLIKEQEWPQQHSGP